MIGARATPRVLSRDIERRKARRTPLSRSRHLRVVSGVRSIPTSIGGYATSRHSSLERLVKRDATVALDADANAASAGTPVDERYAATSAVASVETAILRAEALAICVPAAEKTRTKVAAALLPYLASTDGGVRASTIDGLHALEKRLDPASLLAAMRDPVAAVRAAGTRTISVAPFGRNPRPTYPRRSTWC
jgi:hypothetical protein